MDIESVEREALKLAEAERARLARALLDSLGNVSPQDVERLWLDAAEHRAAEIDGGTVDLADAGDVDRKARMLLR